MKKITSNIKFRIIIIPLVLITMVLEGVNIFLSNQVSSESVTVSRLSSELEEVERRNYALRSEVLEYTSLDRVASRAAELGFVENKKVISLYKPAAVAAVLVE